MTLALLSHLLLCVRLFLCAHEWNWLGKAPLSGFWQGEVFLTQWVVIARMTPACQDAVLKAIDDSKVFVYGELLDVANVQVRWSGV